MDYIPLIVCLILAPIIYFYVSRADESKYEEILEKRKNKSSKTIKSMVVLGKLFISVFPIIILTASFFGFFMVEEPKYLFAGVMLAGGLIWLYRIWFKNEIS